MARVKVADGYSYTGMEAKVETLAIKAAERYIEKGDYAGAAKARAAIRRQYYDSYIRVRDATIKSDLHSFRDFEVSESEKRRLDEIANKRYEAYKRLELIGKSFRSATQGSRIAEYFAAEKVNNLEADRKASMENGERIASAKAWDEQMRKISRRTRMQLNAQKILDAHKAAMDRAEQMNIKKGIWGAFGGKTAILGFLKGFGLWHGASSIGRFGKFLAYGNTLDQAKIAQQAFISAAITGSSALDLTSYGYAIRPYGGGIGDAGSFFQRINRFVQGSLVGKGLGPFGEAALQYGLDISGTGPAGLATKNELIRRISNRLAKMDDREKADFAESLHIDKASFMLMKDGFAKYKERIKYAESGNPFQFGNNNLVETQEAIGKLSSEWDKFWMNMAGSSVVKNTASFLTGMLHDLNEGTSVHRVNNNATSSYEFYKNLDESGMLHKYVSNYIRGSSWKENNGLIDYLNKTGQLRLFVESHDFGVLGGGIKNWVLSQESRGLAQYQQPIPIMNPQPTIQIDFLSNINVSPEAKRELQQIVYPWLETNVITPMIRSTK